MLVNIPLSQTQIKYLLSVLNQDDRELEDVIVLLDEKSDVLERALDFFNRSDIPLSGNQSQFICDVLDADLDESLRLDYSGRGMFGRKCPAIVVSNRNDFKTSADVRMDNMGRDMVIYAED